MHYKFTLAFLVVHVLYGQLFLVDAEAAILDIISDRALLVLPLPLNRLLWVSACLWNMSKAERNRMF